MVLKGVNWVHIDKIRSNGLSMCTQLTSFKTIWMKFYIVHPIYPIDSFQDHLTWFLHSIPNWLLSRPFDLILSMCTQLTPFKTIWPDFYIVYLLLSMCTQLTLFNTIWPDFCIVYTIDSFQDHLTWFLHSIRNWLLSRPYHLIFVLYDMIFGLCTQLTPFKTIWPNFINVYPIDSFQDHMTWFLHCVPIFNNVYPIDSFQHHMTWFLHCLHNWLLSRPFDLILSMCTQLTSFKTI